MGLEDITRFPLYPLTRRISQCAGPMLNSSLINPLFRKTKDKEMVYVCDNATNIHVLCKRSRSKVMHLTISSRLGCPTVSTAKQLLTFRK